MMQAAGVPRAGSKDQAVRTRACARLNCGPCGVRAFLILALGMFAGAGCATSNGQVFAWAVADQPTAASQYAPSATGQWSSTGSSSTVVRTGTGAYSIQFPGAGRIHGGNVQVTAVGKDASYCKVGSWNSTVPDVAVVVYCFNGGIAADSAFAASYGADFPAVPDDAYTWYWGIPAAGAPSTTPYAYFSSNVSSIYTPTDKVMLSIAGVSSVPMEHVTAYGAGPEQCSFNTTGISCFDVSG